jgi:type I restriction enzyme S subunit
MSKPLVPKIRFGGYSEPWEQKSIEETFALRNGYTPSKANSSFWTNGTIPWFRMDDIREQGRVLSDSAQHITPEAVKGGGLFPAGSLILSTTATIGEHALLIADSLANQRFTVFQTVNRWSTVDPEFWLYRFYQLGDWCKKNTNSGGLAAVNIADLKKYQIDYPADKGERDLMVEWFKRLDDMIANAEKEVARLERMKIASLQKMFPRPGQTTPEVRFGGFTEPWEEHKLGDITTSYSGGTPKVGIKDYYGGSIPFIRSGEIHRSSTELFITELGYKESSAAKVVKGDILFALYGATSGDVAISQIDGVINQAILAIKPNDGFSAYFITYWLEYNKNRLIDTYLQGGQGNLSGTIVKSFNLAVPTSFTEQESIGRYFFDLDNLIAKKRDRIVKLRNIKKACLEKMFVNNTTEQ